MAFTHIALPWLLEKDSDGVRFLTLKELVGLPKNDKELLEAKKVANTKGQIGRILKHMKPEGWWNKPGGGYSPKYYSTVWSLILLSQLGASIDDDIRIATACKYYLDHALSKDGSISHNGTASGTFDCLQGNMCAALTDLGYSDERLEKTYDWMARSEIDKDVKYYAYKCGPNFACGAQEKKPCAWGAVKVLLALGKIPKSKRNENINKAIKMGVDFLLSVDPMTAAYPIPSYSTKPNGSWWKLGFPTFYCTDLLQLAEAVASVGFGHDKRLKNTLDFIFGKADEKGRWMLEHDYAGKTWGSFGEKRKPNKWVTYRVLSLLKMLGEE
jgi:hypothetical protein